MTLLLILLCIAVLILFCLKPGPRISAGSLGGTLFAHRGLWNTDCEENTIPAFQRAADRGYGIEMDIRVTRDGVPVILHDKSMMRMYHADVCPEQCLYEEIRSHTTRSGQNIPTLEEALQTVSGRVPLILEIKKCREPRKALPQIQAVLDRYKGTYCIESFHPEILLWYRLHRPSVIRGQLAFRMNADYPYQPGYILETLLLHLVISRPSFIAFDIHSLPSLPLRIAKLYRPLTVAWTVRSKEELDRLKADFPAAIFENFLP